MVMSPNAKVSTKIIPKHPLALIEPFASFCPHLVLAPLVQPPPPERRCVILFVSHISCTLCVVLSFPPDLVPLRGWIYKALHKALVLGC